MFGYLTVDFIGLLVYYVGPGVYYYYVKPGVYTGYYCYYC